MYVCTWKNEHSLDSAGEITLAGDREGTCEEVKQLESSVEGPYYFPGKYGTRLCYPVPWQKLTGTLRLKQVLVYRSQDLIQRTSLPQHQNTTTFL